jgi:pyruvate kinase
VEMISQMLLAGMNVARFNFSHGNHQWHKACLDNLREAMKRTNMNCASMLDTKGPEVRTGFLKGHKAVELKRGQILELSTMPTHLCRHQLQLGGRCHDAHV